jgi:NADH-quinone oxidoreductase E subunit
MALAFSAESTRKIAEILSRYPNKQAALLPVLHVAQAEFGKADGEVQEAVALALDLPLAHVWGVVTFYTMYHTENVGKNVLMVCTNISCMLRRGDDMLAHIEKKLEIKPGGTTADGMFTLIEEECLAACSSAPMMICGDKYFTNLDEAKVDAALIELRAHPRSEH